MVVDLVDAARAGLAVLRSIGLEAALIDVCFLLLYRHRCIGFADLVVDYQRAFAFMKGSTDAQVDASGFLKPLSLFLNYFEFH